MATPPGAPGAGRATAECLARIARGETQGLVDLVHAEQARIVNVLHRMVGDFDHALDLAQETFLRIHARVATFRPDGNAPGWVLAVAVNLARDHLRRRRGVRHRPAVSLEGLAEPAGRASWDDSPHERIERAELGRRVWEVLDSLPELPRTIILLRDHEGLDYETLAEVLGCEIGTVKSRLHRARRLFQERFERREEPA